MYFSKKSVYERCLDGKTFVDYLLFLKMNCHYFCKVSLVLLIVTITKVTTDDIAEILKTTDSIRSMECVQMKTPDCLGLTLPYSMSSNGIVQKYFNTEDQIQSKLYELQASLQFIPKCWKEVQPLLCMIFRPRCFNNHVEMPSQEMCRRIEEPCRIIFEETLWPEFINCSNRELFPQLDNQPHLPLQFGSRNYCRAPLVHTKNIYVTVEGIEGCGLPCKNVLYSDSEHKETHDLIFWSANFCACFNIAAILTYLINWPDGTYSDRAIFYINCCFLVSCIGWLLQFTSLTREAIVCRPDNTPRIAEPSQEGSEACITVFVLIYFSLMSAIIWFGIFIFGWFMRFDEVGPKKYDFKSMCFHFVAWGIPATSTTMIVKFLHIVDGNSMTGICFIGYKDFYLVHSFLIAPLFMIIIASAGYIIADFICEIKSPAETKKFKRMKAVKILSLSLPILITIFVSLVCHLWDGINLPKYRQDFKSYLICTILKRMSELVKSNNKLENECNLKFDPDAVKLHLQILTHFIIGIFMSLFVCEKRSLNLWISLFRRLFRRISKKQSKDLEQGTEIQEMIPVKNNLFNR